MSAHEVAQSVHRLAPLPGEWGRQVVGPDGRIFQKVPNHCDGVYWWFDHDWRPTSDPFAVPLSEAEMLARAHNMADEDNTIAKCYFIGGDDGPVKIGYSVDAEGRLRVLQMSCPTRLRILALASGGAQREAAYHWQFAAHRLHGEWFERVPEIEAEITRLNSTDDQEGVR